MYGVDLTTRVKVEDTAIPNLLTQCIEHIEKSGEWNFFTYSSLGWNFFTFLLVFCDDYMTYMLRSVSSLHMACFTELEAEGLYRVSGQTSELLDLKEKFDSSDKIDFSRYTDINIVCGAVKLYLRELPIPVVTFDAYNEVMKATSELVGEGEGEGNGKEVGGGGGGGWRDEGKEGEEGGGRNGRMKGEREGGDNRRGEGGKGR